VPADVAVLVHHVFFGLPFPLPLRCCTAIALPRCSVLYYLTDYRLPLHYRLPLRFYPAYRLLRLLPDYCTDCRFTGLLPVPYVLHLLQFRFVTAPAFTHYHYPFLPLPARSPALLRIAFTVLPRLRCRFAPALPLDCTADTTRYRSYDTTFYLFHYFVIDYPLPVLLPDILFVCSDRTMTLPPYLMQAILT